MSFISEIFTLSSSWLWFILATTLIFLEIILPGLLLASFAIPAFILGVLTLLVPVPISWQIQMLLFVVISVLMVFISKKYFNYGDRAVEESGLNRPGHRLIGTIIHVDKITSKDKGKAKIGDSVWTIAGDDLVLNADMEVVDLEGNTLIVEPVSA